MPNPNQSDDEQVVLAPEKARQGFMGKRVLLILAVSLMLAVVAMLLSGVISGRS